MFINENNDSPEQKVAEVGNSAALYQIPKNITQNGDIFEQTNAAFNSPNMCLFNTELSQWNGKLRVNVLSLQGKVTFGVMRKADFEKADFLFT